MRNKKSVSQSGTRFQDMWANKQGRVRVGSNHSTHLFFALFWAWQACLLEPPDKIALLQVQHLGIEVTLISYIRYFWVFLQGVFGQKEVLHEMPKSFDDGNKYKMRQLTDRSDRIRSNVVPVVFEFNILLLAESCFKTDLSQSKGTVNGKHP